MSTQEKEFLDKIEYTISPLFNTFHKVYFKAISFRIIGFEAMIRLYLVSHNKLYIFEIYNNISSREIYCKEITLEENNELNSFEYLIPLKPLEVTANFKLKSIALVDINNNTVLEFACSVCFTKEGRDNNLIENASIEKFEKIMKMYIK